MKSREPVSYRCYTAGTPWNEKSYKNHIEPHNIILHQIDEIFKAPQSCRCDALLDWKEKELLIEEDRKQLQTVTSCEIQENF